MRRKPPLGAPLRVSLLTSGGLAVLLAGTAAAVSNCGPAPCAADGTCLPNRPSWGWYNTRWRAWPGEQPGLPPTPAGGAKGEDESPDSLPGLILPDPTKEDKAGSEKTDQKSRGGVGVPDEGALPDPEAMPELDPFSQRDERGAPQVQLGLPAARGVVTALPHVYDDQYPAPSYVQPLPAVIDNPAVARPASNLAPLGGPNLNSEDAPPALPASLQSMLPQSQQPAVPSPVAAAVPYGRALSPVRPAQPQQLAPAAPVALGQPASVTPSQTPIRPVTWETPGGIALVNPAAAVEVEAGAEGTKRAIYYEVSDASPDTASQTK